MGEVYYALEGAPGKGFRNIFKTGDILTIFLHIIQGIILLDLVCTPLWYFPFNSEFGSIWCSLGV